MLELSLSSRPNFSALLVELVESVFHVRDDGWMGASLTMERPITIDPGKPLRLRYGLLVHLGVPEPVAIEGFWKAFAREPIPDLPSK